MGIRCRHSSSLDGQSGHSYEHGNRLRRVPDGSGRSVEQETLADAGRPHTAQREDNPKETGGKLEDSA